MRFPSTALLWLAGALAACSTGPELTPAATPPLTPIPALDVSRYSGGWYEIAKYPNWFQRNCASDTKADYRPMPDQTIQVTNRCRSKSGELQEIVGTARTSVAGHSAQLQVTFVPHWLEFLPFVWADYWVIDIDPAYQLVAVSEPRRKYLWILSRTPNVDEQQFEALRTRLTAKGFEVDKLERTNQPK